MKLSNKLNSLLVAPLAIALFAACSTDENLSDGGVSGQTLTFLALNAESEDAAGSRTIFDNTVGEGSTMDKVTAKWDTTNDKVVVYGGNNYQNCGDFKVSKLSADGKTATLTGKIPTAVTEEGTPMYAYVSNANIKKFNGGKHLEVDYSKQEGTFEDAMAHTLFWAKTTYTTKGDMQFKFLYKTTYLKLTLDFGDANLNSTASLLLNGTKISSLSRINAINNKTDGTDNSGGTNNIDDTKGVTIEKATITNGKSVVYVALYPQKVKDVTLVATLADGTKYNFDISKGKEAMLGNGAIYHITRTGVKEVKQ